MSSSSSLKKKAKHKPKKAAELAPYALHKAVVSRDIEAVRGVLDQLFDTAAISALDASGNSALHLAVFANDVPIVRLLLERGARCNLRNSRRWSLLSLSRSVGSVELVRLCTRAGAIEVARDYQTRVRQLLPLLAALPDFALTIDWNFTSWLPGTGRFCPSDKCLLQKQGSSLRLDFTLVAFENLAWQRGEMSAIVQGTGANAGRLSIVDWKARTERRPIESTLHPEFPLLAFKDAQALMKQKIGVLDSDIEAVTFQPRRGWFSSAQTEETVGGHLCKLWEMVDMKMQWRSRPAAPFTPAADGAEVNTSERRGVLDATYFDPPHDDDQKCELLFPGEAISYRTKALSGTVAICDDFPLSLQQLLPLFELLAPTNAHFEKLQSFLSSALPPGFPIKFEMPVVPTVSASVQFAFEPLGDRKPDFVVPSDFKWIRYKESFKGEEVGGE